MTDIFTEYQVVSNICKQLIDARDRVILAQRKPGGDKDILLMAHKAKLDNDISELRKVIGITGERVVTHMETMYGCQFKFLGEKNNPRQNGHMKIEKP